MQIEALAMTPVTLTGTSHLGETEAAEPIKPFGEYLKDSLQTVNGLQLEAARLNRELAAGRVEDIGQVVVAGEKASIAVSLTSQLRTKAVEAYQEIMRMQV